MRCALKMECLANTLAQHLTRPTLTGIIKTSVQCKVQTGTAAWCVNWDMPVSKSGGPWKSSQPACSQFCDELAASAVNAVTDVHAIALEPAGRSRLHCSAHAVMSMPDGWWLVPPQLDILGPAFEIGVDPH